MTAKTERDLKMRIKSSGAELVRFTEHSRVEANGRTRVPVRYVQKRDGAETAFCVEIEWRQEDGQWMSKYPRTGWPGVECPESPDWPAILDRP